MTIGVIPLENATQAKITSVFAATVLIDRDIMAGPCRVVKITATQKAQDYVIRLWDNKNPTIAVTIPDCTIRIPSGASKKSISIPNGLVFSAGLSVAATDTAADNAQLLSTANAVFTLDLLPGVS